MVAVSAGDFHSCALTSAGMVKCWGNGDEGELGDGNGNRASVPVDVIGLGAGVTAVTSGGSHSCAVTSVGALKCWGYNVDGALGDGTTNSAAVPVDVVGLGSGVVAVSGGRWYSCAVTSAGAAKCWGDNGSGELGRGTYSSSVAPVGVAGLGSGVSAVAAGGNHSCAVALAGVVKCWGNNGSGQLGDGTGMYSNVPVNVDGR